MSIVKKIICLLLVLALCLSLGGCKKKKKKKIIIVKRPGSNVSDTAEDVTYDDSEFETEITDDGFDDSSFEDGAQDNGDYISGRELYKTESGAEAIIPEYTVKEVDFQITKDYKIVYPKGNEQLRQAAEKLSKYFAKNKIDLSVVTDSAAKSDKEILIGNTNRKKSALAENKYAVSISGKKLVFESGNFNGAVKAVSWFIALPYKKGKTNTLTGEYTFASKIKRPSGTYSFVWGDEFDGNALDTSKWGFSTSISAESSFKLSREPEAVNVSEGLLKLTARRWFDPDNNQIQAIAPYTIESKKHLNFQYGYLEMRARIPFGGGAWPSLWLSGACRTDAVVSDLFEKGDIIPSNFSAEFDIVEYTSLQPNLHKWFYEEHPDVEGVDSQKHSSLGAVETPVKSDIGLDVAQSYVYQTIAFDWTPEDLTIYINGQQHYKYNWKKSVQLDAFNDMSDFLNPVFIRINNHLIPSDIPSDFSTLPLEYYVDYIRLYQKSGTGGIWLAD